MLSPSRSALLLIGILFIASSSAVLTNQFQHFYPQHSRQYEFILQNNCSQEFQNYLTGRLEDFPIDWLGGGGKTSVLVQPVVTCLLDTVSEYIKAASSSAQVLLGVTPPILATLGASTDELAMVNVVGRRPLLALLISVGSPSVYLDRIFDFRAPSKMLQLKEGQHVPYTSSSTTKRVLMTAMQYAVVGLAAANIALLNWQLGLGTVCSWWSNTVYGPLVWGVLSIPIHFGGTFALRLRVRRIYSNEEKQDRIGFVQWWRLMPQRLYRYTQTEFIPAAFQEQVIRLVSFDERKIFVAWSWFLSTATVIHILFGSLLFSGLLFIGPQDALLVIFRYILSVLACRILVIYELAGMRQQYRPEADDDSADGYELDPRMVRIGHAPRK
ncbi:hypothetical protein GGR57DRAFT_84851 [Xylariaceae sp. FL1272]|nr:hypothetical protein GGR57DRAFT_84851 [Xylariaceae sp. FL1272]